MADTTYQPKVYFKQGGDELVIADGGKLVIEPGGEIVEDGTQAAGIADITVSGTYGDDDDAIETAVNSILAALRGAGIIASS